MKKELLKGFTMLMLIVVLAFASAVAAKAQSSDRIVADIPFEFSVGDESMPSGQYAVKTANSRGSDNTGRRLLKSRQERAIERELASTRSKSQPAQSSYETIEVLAALR